MRNGAMFSSKQWAGKPPESTGGSKANATPRAKQAAAATPPVCHNVFRCAASVASPHAGHRPVAHTTASLQKTSASRFCEVLRANFEFCNEQTKEHTHVCDCRMRSGKARNLPQDEAKKKWSQLPESNRRPGDYKSTALPTELSWHL